MKKNIFFSVFAAIIAIGIVLAFARFSSLQEVNSIEINKINEINFNEENNILLDVRTENEFKQGRILKAKNIDVMNFGFQEAIKTENKNSNYYIYCRSGSRSLKAYNLLKSYGFKNITNLEGGIQNYKGILDKP